MKIRQGFVSNSSSSSYTCDVCGVTETLYDPSGYFLSCEADHWFCDSCKSKEIDSKIDEFINNLLEKSNEEIVHILFPGEESYDKNQREEWLEELCNFTTKEEKEGALRDYFYDHPVPEAMCPFCNLDMVQEGTLKLYLRCISEVEEEEIFKEIKKVNKRRRKLYDHEYISYVCVKLGKTTMDVEREIQEKFKNEAELIDFVNKEMKEKGK